VSVAKAWNRHPSVSVNVNWGSGVRSFTAHDHPHPVWPPGCGEVTGQAVCASRHRVGREHQLSTATAGLRGRQAPPKAVQQPLPGPRGPERKFKPLVTDGPDVVSRRRSWAADSAVCDQTAAGVEHVERHRHPPPHLQAGFAQVYALLQQPRNPGARPRRGRRARRRAAPTGRDDSISGQRSTQARS
jgi:hypothetical protein